MLPLAQVDELMQTQFREPMQRIVDHCGKRREGGRQTVLVSATLSDKVCDPCEFAHQLEAFQGSLHMRQQNRILYRVSLLLLKLRVVPRLSSRLHRSDSSGTATSHLPALHHQTIPCLLLQPSLHGGACKTLPSPTSSFWRGAGLMASSNHEVS